MKLNGTKLILASAIALAASIAQAKQPDNIQLTTFTAGTPAKAAEINENFNNIKAYGKALADIQNDQQSTITNLNSHVSNVTKSITENSVSIAALTIKTADLETAVNTNVIAIKDLNSSSDTLATRTSNNRTAITALNTKATEIHTFVTNNTRDVTELNTKATNLGSVITAQAALIEALEAKVTALESIGTSTPNHFTLPVMGDGQLIGYTDRAPKINDDFILVKTADYGLVTIKARGSKYYVLGYNESSGQEAKESGVLFTDNVCNAAAKVFNIDSDNQFLFTPDNESIHYSAIVSDYDSTPYILTSGAILDRTTLDFYQLDGERNCVFYLSLSEGSFSIPLKKANLEDHGIKEFYTDITIEGYVSN
jgi:uncharacterized coiled-coil protein SlyX